MLVASFSYARAVGVLLGGSGVCEPVAEAKRDVGALLSPRRRQTRHDVVSSTSAISVDSPREADGHD